MLLKRAIVPIDLRLDCKLYPTNNLQCSLLSPDDDVITDAADTEMSDAKEFVRKMNIVSLKDKESSDKDDKHKTSAAEEQTEMDVMAENVSSPLLFTANLKEGFFGSIKKRKFVLVLKKLDF